MKILDLLRTAAVAAMAVAGLGAASATPPAAPDPMAGLAWMAGDWRGEQDGQQMEEVWTAPSGGTMLGMHRDVAGGKTVSFEFLRIAREKEGVVYWASPMGRPAMPFRMKDQGPGRRVTFENPEHDFPRKISYWIGEDGLLHARVEGLEKGQPLVMEWAWSNTRQ